MDNKPNSAVNDPVAATDQAPSEAPDQAPITDAEQGSGTVTAETSTSSLTTDTASPAETTTEPTPEQNAAPTTSESAQVTSETATEPTETAPTPVESATPEEAIEPVEATSAPSEDGASVPSTPEPIAVEQTAEPSAQSEALTSAPSDNITMEDVLAASDEQLGRKPIHRGMIVTGTIIMLAQDGIIIDVGAKIEGLLPYSQLFEFEANAEEAAKYFKPGDEIQTYVVRSDVPNNVIVLSKKRADQERAWNLLQDIYDKQKPVEVEIVEKVRGGLVANLGVRAFLPASQVDVRRVNDLDPFLGQRLKVKIIELNRKRNRVIVSRRAIVEEEIAEQKQETLQKLEPGVKLEGEVVEITDFGAFVNLGGIDGLVHRSELTHGRFNHPKDVVKVGQKVNVEVLDMDLERERINLSMKSLKSDPWENVLANYSIGQKIAGKVTNLTPFGAFVEIEPGLEGLIHVSEMSWTKRVRHPKEIVEEGEDVEAMILKVDTNQQRISLGLRQTQPDPWSSLPDRFPPGTEVTGPITGITEFGVFMEIEEGIEGLVHISELAHEHIEDISDHFNKGDEITAVILNIDPVEQRASLSRKRLLPYTAEYADAASAGAPRGGSRKGRRGGRRGADIDYDYSYAATDTGAKTTTKLGDVYADLFAQFGLSEGKADDQAGEEAETGVETAADTTEAVADSGQVEASETQPSSTDVEVAPAQESVAEAPDDGNAASVDTLEPAEATAEIDTAEAKPVLAEAEEDIDPENAIDAAEAAALLTAAFREGKRPPKVETEVGEFSDASADAQVATDTTSEFSETEEAEAVVDADEEVERTEA